MAPEEPVASALAQNAEPMKLGAPPEHEASAAATMTITAGFGVRPHSIARPLFGMKERALARAVKEAFAIVHKKLLSKYDAEIVGRHRHPFGESEAVP